MFKKYFNLTIIILIMLVAIVTRFYKLGDAPEGFYVDEAGQGYSAYSILQTGKDEFGKPFPVVFRSLTDFKTPVYIYLITPLIPLFGLNAFTVRFPSFFFSILTIPVLYLLVKLLSKNNNLALLSSFLLAISPWHILFGRTNFECNVALFFYLSGILAFYKSLVNPKYLILSAITFAIAIPAYHSQRIITPLTMFVLFLRHHDVLLTKKYKSFLLAGLFIGLILSLPTISVINTPGFLARASGLNIFSHNRQMPDGYIAEYNGAWGAIVNSSLYLSTREFFSLYFSYLSPRFMFDLGDYGPRSSFPELSTFFVWQLPFYLLGFYFLLKNKIDKDKLDNNFKEILVTMLFVSAIPAAVTRDPYTTIRALPLVIPQIILIAFGILELSKSLRLKNPKFTYLTVGSITILYSLIKIHSSVILLNEYYRAKYWDWGWEKVVNVLQKQDDRISVTIDNARSDPDLILAFFLKYPPDKYQKENKEVELDDYYTNLKRAPVKYLGNITIRPIVWKSDLLTDQILVSDELGISTKQIEDHKLKLIEEIKYPSGETAFRIVKTNPKYEISK